MKKGDKSADNLNSSSGSLDRASSGSDSLNSQNDDNSLSLDPNSISGVDLESFGSVSCDSKKVKKISLDDAEWEQLSPPNQKRSKKDERLCDWSLAE